MTDTDEIIISKIRAGDINLYTHIVDRYEAKIGRYIRRIVGTGDQSQDILQDVFIKVYININSFDVDKKFNSWIYRIAHNECVNFLKKKKSIGFSFFDLDTFLPAYNLNTDSSTKSQDLIFIEKENKEKIEKALQVLDLKYREVIVMSYFEDLDYKEISQALQIPISTVGVRIMRAKKQLQAILKDANIDTK